MKRFLVSFLACGLLVAMLPAVAAGGGALPVVIEDEVTIDPGDGEFEARGPAVDAGLMCAAGDTTSTGYSPTGLKRHIDEFIITKTFTCEDASGSWTALLDVQLNRKTTRTTANWVIVSGTGDYVDLTGSGRLRGVPIEPGVSILDIYRGNVE